jgi:hypothetical protein
MREHFLIGQVQDREATSNVAKIFKKRMAPATIACLDIFQDDAVRIAELTVPSDKNWNAITRSESVMSWMPVGQHVQAATQSFWVAVKEGLPTAEEEEGRWYRARMNDGATIQSGAQ